MKEVILSSDSDSILLHNYRTQRCRLINLWRYYMNGNKKNNCSSYGMAIGMCIGLSIGTAIGSVSNNIGLWMPIGLSAGMCMGLVLSHRNEDSDEDDKDNRDE